jgi:hypothetical protein
MAALSHTCAVGEKCLNPLNYGRGLPIPSDTQEQICHITGQYTLTPCNRFATGLPVFSDDTFTKQLSNSTYKGITFCNTSEGGKI